MSFGYKDAHDAPYPEEMQKARARVKAACKSANVAFLEAVRPDSVIRKIKEGVMIGSGSEETAEIGRKYTRRAMPW